MQYIITEKSTAAAIHLVLCNRRKREYLDKWQYIGNTLLNMLNIQQKYIVSNVHLHDCYIKVRYAEYIVFIVIFFAYNDELIKYFVCVSFC